MNFPLTVVISEKYADLWQEISSNMFHKTGYEFVDKNCAWVPDVNIINMCKDYLKAWEFDPEWKNKIDSGQQEISTFSYLINR